ncbi:MAG: cation transporter [Clostridia bacterium]|nr:cation transporter [Clostridia bacterium]
MKTEKNILIAFILNLIFSVFEFIGGTLSGSVAIVSDALHDLGDAISIGISYFLEHKSKKQPDDVYTFGYIRFSLIGSLITTVILLLSSIVVIYNAITRVFNPVSIDYNVMIIFAIIGTIVNLFAAIITKDGDSLNQKAVNLHMLEDVLGWIVVLVGALVMRFTDFAVLDPILSIFVSVFILINAVKNFIKIESVFLEKTPVGISIQKLKEHILEIDGVLDVHHIHVWSMDGYNNYATMHIVTNEENHEMKEKIRNELKEHNIGHVTLELETSEEHCHYMECHIDQSEQNGHHHGHCH